MTTVPSSQYVLSLRAANKAGFSMELLKDVVTKRKSALGEHENLYPPLNVQSVAISAQSVEVRWHDWHLKADELIPDDRHYTLRYNVATSSVDTAQSNTRHTPPHYVYKNSSERHTIVSGLEANTLYDFAVRLVIGRRESEWSMTTSQMTMEASPAPQDITIKSHPNSPSSVLLTWQMPDNAQLSTGLHTHTHTHTPFRTESTIYCVSLAV